MQTCDVLSISDKNAQPDLKMNRSTLSLKGVKCLEAEAKCVCKTGVRSSPKKLKYDFFSRYQREVRINLCFQRTVGGGGGEATSISHYMSPPTYVCCGENRDFRDSLLLLIGSQASPQCPRKAAKVL